MKALFYSGFITKLLLLIGVFTFMFVSFLGFSHTNMTMGLDGQMSSSGCFMPGMTASFCQMNPLEHITAWQGMFTVVPSQNDILALLLILLTLVLGAFFLHSHQSTVPPKTPVSQFQFLYYKRRIPIISPLQEAFSNGILHPKVF